MLDFYQVFDKLCKEILFTFPLAEKISDKLKDINISDKIVVISIGKAAWEMANIVSNILPHKISKGFVLTKYNHSKGSISNFEIFEAGHPILDANSIKHSSKIINFCLENQPQNILFLISGGGSSLFEIPKKGVSLEMIQKINEKLIRGGASINEINLIRKLLSQVKNGGFLKVNPHAKIFTLILSDIIDGKFSQIASGPTEYEKLELPKIHKIIQEYKLEIPEELIFDNNKNITNRNSNSVIVADNQDLLLHAQTVCKKYGFDAEIISDPIIGNVIKESEAIVGHLPKINKNQIMLLGGEVTVDVKGNGKGGRAQELSLRLAEKIAGQDYIVCCFGSDGSDGPTDADGAIVDGETLEKLNNKQIDIDETLKNNNSYNALNQIKCLFFTGPTGINLNDVVLIMRK